MARPKAKQEEKRVCKITVRFNAAERKAIEKVAKESGLSLYLVVRQKLLTGRFPEPKLARVDMAVYVELKKIGVNLNQLTRFTNSGLFPIGIRELLLQLLQHEQFIIKLLLSDSQSKDR